MKKVCVVVTARPSYSRIKTALQAIQEHPGLELQLVLTAWAANTMVDQVKADGFDPIVGEMIEVDDSLASMVTVTASLSHALAYLFREQKPDIVVTVADRYETLGTAIAASYQNIPLVHVQGGESTGSIDDRVRNAVTQLADWHFVSTKQAWREVFQALRGTGGPRVIQTGCPSIDLAAQTKVKPMNGSIIVMQHPVTTEFGSVSGQFEETSAAVAAMKMPSMWFGPNRDAGHSTVLESNEYREYLPPEEFLSLLASSRVLVGNSSVGIRECSYLGVPVVNIGSRQQNRERAKNVIDVGYDRTEIQEAIETQMEHGRYPSSNLYGDGKAGERIASALEGVLKDQS